MNKPNTTYAIELHDAASGELFCTVTRLVWNAAGESHEADWKELTRFFANSKSEAATRAKLAVRTLRHMDML
jgi:hypothetical protein